MNESGETKKLSHLVAHAQTKVSLAEPKVIIFRMIKLSSLAVNISKLMIDRRHPDGGLLYLSVVYLKGWIIFKMTAVALGPKILSRTRVQRS